MTNMFRQAAFQESCAFERPAAQIRYKKKFFTLSHKVFLNKILVEIEGQRRDRLQRRERIWTEGKKNLGFEDSFNVGGSFLNSSIESVDGGNGFESIAYDRTKYDNDFFEANEVVSQLPASFSPVPIKEADDELNNSLSTLRLPASAPHPPYSELPEKSCEETPFIGSTRQIDTSSSAMSSAPYVLNGGKEKPPPSLQVSFSRASTSQSHNRPKKKLPGVLAQRKRKAFNRITYFENILELTPVPGSPVPRYGQLTSPIKVTRNQTQ